MCISIIQRSKYVFCSGHVKVKDQCDPRFDNIKPHNTFSSFHFLLIKYYLGQGKQSKKNKKGMEAERESVLYTSQAVNDEEEERERTRQDDGKKKRNMREKRKKEEESEIGMEMKRNEMKWSNKKARCVCVINA